MARVISVCLPMWPIDRLRRAGGTLPDEAPAGAAPLVLTGRAGSRRVVTAACEGALALGLRPGMAITKAQAMVPDLRVEPADPEADLAGLERLALWLMQRIAPVVAVDPPDGVVIDSTGADHLHGGEAAMLEALAGKLALSGITARLALADSWGAAHALARYRADPALIAETGTDQALLSPLPLEALRDRKSTRLNSSHSGESRMPSSA